MVFMLIAGQRRRSTLRLDTNHPAEPFADGLPPERPWAFYYRPERVANGRLDLSAALPVLVFDQPWTGDVRVELTVAFNDLGYPGDLSVFVGCQALAEANQRAGPTMPSSSNLVVPFQGSEASRVPEEKPLPRIEMDFRSRLGASIDDGTAAWQRAQYGY